MLDEIACSHPTILSSSAIVEDSERDTSDAFAMGTCVPITTASWPEDLKQPYPGTWWYVFDPPLPSPSYKMSTPHNSDPFLSHSLYVGIILSSP